MKAMVLKAANTPFIHETLPAPEPGPGQRRFQIRDLRLRHVRNFGIVLHLATSGWWTLLISAAFCHKIRIT